MRFLIDADLPRSTAALLKRYDHEATDVRDIGLREAKDREIAAYARAKVCPWLPETSIFPMSAITRRNNIQESSY